MHDVEAKNNTNCFKTVLQELVPSVVQSVLWVTVKPVCMVTVAVFPLMLFLKRCTVML